MDRSLSFAVCRLFDTQQEGVVDDKCCSFDLFSVSFHEPFYASACFFTHHVDFGCFVSLFPYYGTRTRLARRFISANRPVLRTPSTIQQNDLRRRPLPAIVSRTQLHTICWSRFFRRPDRPRQQDSVFLMRRAHRYHAFSRRQPSALCTSCHEGCT